MVALKLVTGPANSAKAGAVVGGYRERLGEEPLLVVPGFRDVEWARRELAERGAVLGARVVRFRVLFEEIARRAGVRARPASRLQRELLAGAAAREAGLEELAASAERPGFARAAARFAAELERAMVEPEALAGALARWAGRGPRRRYAREVAAIYSGYRERLDAAGLAGSELAAWRALEALRRAGPGAWGGTPVFLYGFDGFTELELAAIELLAGPAGAEVAVSLPYEPGREAFRAIEQAHARLAALAGERVALEPLADHYADTSRAALHHLERRLYEGAGERLDPGGAVRLLSAGGARAEAELVAAEALALLREGVPAGEIAVVYRDPQRYATLVEQVFGAYGIPFSLERRLPLGHTALGRRLVERARELESGRGGAREPAGLAAELEETLERAFASPWRRAAHVLAPEELEDASAFRAARAALAEMRALADAGGGTAAAGTGGRTRRPRRPLPTPAHLLDALAGLEVRLGEGPRPDRVLVASPEAVRARRFEAVFVCGLQEGEFPRGERPEPFLSDDDRTAIAARTGLELPLREDPLARERYLFYVCASRAERRLVLSSRTCDEEGTPEPRSFFVEDVRELFADALDAQAGRRALSEVVWPPERAPTPAEHARALALAGPRRRPPRPGGLTAEPVLERLRAQEAFSAGALEAFAACPVRWVVEKLIAPADPEPDPEYLVRGSYAHAALERTFTRLRERTGSARVTPESLPEAERLAREALQELEPRYPVSPSRGRRRAAARRLELELVRRLRREAESDCRFEPREVELAFGLAGHGGGDRDGDDDGLPAAELAPGVKVRGRIDRVDVLGGHALVRDYKAGNQVPPVARWERDRKLQAQIYMLAVRELLGLEPAGGVYVPLAGEKHVSRGLLSAEHAEALGSADFHPNDFEEPEAFEAHLERARAAACELVERARAGDVRPCPRTCSPGRDGGCAYPSICGEER